MNRILKGHLPRVRSRWRAESVNRAAARTDQSGGNLPPFDQFDHTVDGVAFRDASEVQLHSRFIERDRSRRWIQRHMAAADMAPCAGELRLRR